MGFFAAMPLVMLGDAAVATDAMRSYLVPVISGLGGLASLAAVFFLVTGGIQYMTSAGKPDKLEDAKKVIRNALIGLVIVLGAGVLTAILSHAYTSSGVAVTEKMPALVSVEPAQQSGDVVNLLSKAITGLVKGIITSIDASLMKALAFFTNATPVMAGNAAVFNLWLGIVGMTDALFVLVVVLLGFHVMSYATFGLDEIEFKHLLPQIGLIFLLINTSIFLIDAIISLSNGMIYALQSSFPCTSVWLLLTSITNKADGLSLAALLIMIVFVILAVILLVYYIGRLITLYIGAVLSPLVMLLWLVPGFRDFAESAAKMYLVTIFVLFVHVVIIQLASSIFTSIPTGSNSAPDAAMSMILGLATIMALLKTQGAMSNLTYASIGPKTARKLGGQFVNGVSYLSTKLKSASKPEAAPLPEPRPRPSHGGTE
jgi:hypothetical protein